MNTFQRRVIYLEGKNRRRTQRGMLKLIQREQSLRFELNIPMREAVTLFVGTAAGIRGVDASKRWGILNGLAADEILAAAIFCGEDLCFAGGEYERFMQYFWREYQKEFYTHEIERAPRRPQHEERHNEKRRRFEEERRPQQNREHVHQPQRPAQEESRNQDMLKSMLPLLIQNMGKEGGGMEQLLPLFMQNMGKESNADMMQMFASMMQKGQKSPEKSAKQQTSQDEFERMMQEAAQKAAYEDMPQEKEPVMIKEEKSAQSDMMQDVPLNAFQWTRQEYPLKGQGYFLNGNATIDGKKYSAVGIPGSYSVAPPPWLQEFHQFARIDGQGYWIKIEEE